MLCIGENIYSPAGLSGAPLNAGSGNNLKIALADYPQFTYEIQCVQNPINMVTGAGNVASLEACIEICNAQNLATANSCLGGYYFNNTTPSACSLANTLSTAYNSNNNPPNLQLPNALTAAAKRSFRLLTSATTYGTQVRDAVIFQSNISGSGDLGLCGGPNGTNYANTFIAMQFQDGSWSNSALQLWEIGCGGTTWRPTGATALVTATIAANNNVAVPLTAEDCGRLCNYQQRLNQQVSNPTACQSWEWVASTSTCNLYSTRTANSGNAASRNDGTVTVGGLWLNGLYQTDNILYKRDVPPMSGAIGAGRYRRGLENMFGEVKPDLVLPAVMI